MTENAPPHVSDWLACHSCNRSYQAVNMMRFDYHPGDALCVTCAESLYNRSRPIHRRLHPIWPLAPRALARLRPARKRLPPLHPDPASAQPRTPAPQRASARK